MKEMSISKNQGRLCVEGLVEQGFKVGVEVGNDALAEHVENPVFAAVGFGEEDAKMYLFKRGECVEFLNAFAKDWLSSEDHQLMTALQYICKIRSGKIAGSTRRQSVPVEKVADVMEEIRTEFEWALTPIDALQQMLSELNSSEAMVSPAHIARILDTCLEQAQKRFARACKEQEARLGIERRAQR